MRITLKLYASLGEYLPADRRRCNELPVELPEGTSVSQALAPWALPAGMVPRVLFNGHNNAPEHRYTHLLKEGDALAVWPPIAGG